MATRYEKIYALIENEINEIIDNYKYESKSAAFCHLLVKILCGANDEEAFDSVIDGFDDNGIDAVYIDERNQNHVYFIQAKYPDDVSGLCKGVTRQEILKLCEGYEHFIGNDETFNRLKWNELAKEKREDFINVDDSFHTLIVARFSSSQKNNESSLSSKVDSLKKQTGNYLDFSYILAEKICDLYEKFKLNTWPSFEVKYKKDMSPFEDDYATICFYYVSLLELYKGIKDIKENIFDGNVRYFDNSSKVNVGILNTLENDSSRFHLLNNGLTIVCSNIKNKSATNTLKIEKGSIVNGAQTVGCIVKVIETYLSQGKDVSKFENSYVNIKVIQLSEDKNGLVDELVYTLNTQNQMKNSYVVSNDIQIKGIQEIINRQTDYFLQIKNNEYNYQKSLNPSFNKLAKNVINIETAIQCFVAYENIESTAFLAKNGKGLLFEEKNIKLILDNITADKAIRDYEYYLFIMEITKQYRSYRKDNNKKDIITTLGINESDIDKYKFINTGNYLMLTALGEFSERGNVNDIKKSLIKVIGYMANYFDGKDHISNLTKTKETFEEICKLIRLKKKEEEQ